MKKFFIILLALTVSGGLFAQDTEEERELTLLERVEILERELEEYKSAGIFRVDGEVKTGIIWEKIEDRITAFDPDIEKEDVGFHNKNDAGNSTGRFRLNMNYLNSTRMFGFKVRLQWDGFNTNPHLAPNFEYAFGYGNFFKDQLTVSIGRLGASPWGTGGPEMWRELEVTQNTTLGVAGMRVEFKPKFKFLEGHEINLGFVLNGPEDIADGGLGRAVNLLDILSETVIGLSYKNKWIMVRGAFRFDSELDNSAGRTGLAGGKDGTKLVYRIEEYGLDSLVKGLGMWVLGEFMGLGSDPKDMFYTRNWFIFQYEPDFLTAQLRLGVQATHTRTLLFLRPNFSYRFFKGLLEPGIIFGIGWDFGEKLYEKSPFSYIEIEPKLQVNFNFGGFNSYIAFVYYYRLEYKYAAPPPELQTQWFNLQFGIKF